MKTSEVYNTLFHYTNSKGLLGILRSQSLWATHYKFLNDYSELSLFRTILHHALRLPVKTQFDEIINRNPNVKKLIESDGGINAVIDHDISVTIDTLYNFTAQEIYISSFCGEHPDDQYINDHGLLSQWRGYGDDGGFALVFRTKSIEDMLEIEADCYDYNFGYVTDLIYSDDESRFVSEMVDEISKLCDYIRKLFEAMKLNDDEAPDAGEAALAFLKCIGRYKHRGFKEENEVRILAGPNLHDDEFLTLAENEQVTLKPEKVRRMRDGENFQVPYIELFGLWGRDLPIERIIVGPHRDKKRRAASLRTMLAKTGIYVTVSDIPFAG